MTEPTNEQIRLAVAKCLGYQRNPIYDQHHNESKTTIPQFVKKEAWVSPDNRLMWPENLPNYPEDLNACAEFEETIPQLPYLYALQDILKVQMSHTGEVFQMIHASARQRCLAFLRVKGVDV